MQTYNLSQFSAIKSNYELPDTIMDILRNLENEMGILSGGVSSEQAVNSQPRLRKKKPMGNSDMEWETLRNFKATVLEKKSGSMDDIRICLNKISIKNYATNRDQILEYIRSLKEDQQDEFRQIAETVFQIASTNKFFSELYAKLYKELCDQYDVYKNILTDFVESFVKTKMQTIEYVDPSTNYDAFCAYNKSNDARKACSAFIVNLLKQGLVGLDTFTSMILEIMDTLRKNIDLEGKVNEVDELTENLYIFITESKDILKDTTHPIYTAVKEFASIKSKQKPSLSSRAIFKFMDMVDRISKK